MNIFKSFLPTFASEYQVFKGVLPKRFWIGLLIAMTESLG
jgi:hypothetical protein